MNKRVTIVTHSGSFHPDDVFAVASLQLLCDRRGIATTVVRSRDQKVIEAADYVVDVGGIYDEARERFDHHQSGGAGRHSNGVPHASFGLVWKKHGSEITGSEVIAGYIEKNLVSPIDYGDNLGLPLSEISPGVYPYTIDRMIAVFNHTYGETDRSADEVFMRLVEFAQEIVKREIAKTRSFEDARAVVERIYTETSDKRIVVLDGEYLWYPILSKFSEPLFVIFPDVGTGNWGVSAVRKGEYDFKNRKDFPLAWGGKRNDELAKISGVSDALFCHNRLFFAVARSKDGAVALARKALED